MHGSAYIYFLVTEHTRRQVHPTVPAPTGRNANFALKLMHLVKHQNKHLFSLRQKARRIEDPTLGHSQAGPSSSFPTGEPKQCHTVQGTSLQHRTTWLLLCHPRLSAQLHNDQNIIPNSLNSSDSVQFLEMEFQKDDRSVPTTDNKMKPATGREVPTGRRKQS